MKSTVLNIAALSALVLGTLASNAANVNVPFSFEAKGVNFPAGQYSVTQSLNSSFITLQSKEWPTKHFSWVSHPDDPTRNGDAVLTFERGESGTTLRSISISQSRTNNFSGKEKIRGGEKLSVEGQISVGNQ